MTRLGTGGGVWCVLVPTVFVRLNNCHDPFGRLRAGSSTTSRKRRDSPLRMTTKNRSEDRPLHEIKKNQVGGIKPPLRGTAKARRCAADLRGRKGAGIKASATNYKLRTTNYRLLTVNRLNQARRSTRLVMLSMRSRRGSKPMPGPLGTVMVPRGLTVTSGEMMSSCQ